MSQRISSQRSTCRVKIKSTEKKIRKRRELFFSPFYLIFLSINFFPTLHIEHLRSLLSHRTHFSIHERSNLRSMSCKRFVNSPRITTDEKSHSATSYHHGGRDVLSYTHREKNFCYFSIRWRSPRRKQISLANPFVQVYPTNIYIPTHASYRWECR